MASLVRDTRTLARVDIRLIPPTLRGGHCTRRADADRVVEKSRIPDALVPGPTPIPRQFDDGGFHRRVHFAVVGPAVV